MAEESASAGTPLRGDRSLDDIDREILRLLTDNGRLSYAKLSTAVRLSPNAVAERVRYVKEFGQKIPNARPSMLLDHLAGRRAEVDNINGAIPREGQKIGIATPVNSLVVALLRAKESGFK